MVGGALRQCGSVPTSRALEIRGRLLLAQDVTFTMKTSEVQADQDVGAPRDIGSALPVGKPSNLSQSRLARSAGRFHLSFLPIPVLVIVMAAVYQTIKPSVFYDPPWLILIGNTLFIAVVSFIVAYIALKNYRGTGSIQVLLLGCGVLVFGIGGVLAAVVRGLPGGANLNVTIYNAGALLGAVFHLLAALLLLAGISPETRVSRRGARVLFGYLGCVFLMGLLTLGSVQGLMPPFFIQGVGPTLLRQQVLGAADILFVFSFLVFMATYLRSKEAFLYWYACALALTAISLTAFFLQSSVGSPLGWVGRFSQYVGGVYFIISLLAAGRSTGTRGTTPLDNALAASLSRAEEALRQSEQRYRSLFEHMLDGFAYCRMVYENGLPQDFIHLNVNEAFERLTGLRGVVGRRASEVLPDIHQTNPELLRIYGRVALTGQPERFETYLKPLGIWLSVAVYSQDKEHFVAVFDNITERKRAEQVLARSKEELERLVVERTAKLEDMVRELEHFSYSITHDMRAPLRGMQGFAELMAEECAPCQKQEAMGFLHRIKVSAARMDTLITDALNYSRAVRQELTLEPIDVGPLVRGMLDSYPEFQRSRAHIEIRGELPLVMGNTAALTQCFSNLLGNSVKFAKPGQRPEIGIWAERRDQWVRIWVEDNGIGIAKAMLPRVFEMFSRGHSTYEGTGIGLALVRKVVERMGGKVGAESEEGKGSRFWLELKPGASIGFAPLKNQYK